MCKESGLTLIFLYLKFSKTLLYSDWNKDYNLNIEGKMQQGWGFSADSKNAQLNTNQKIDKKKDAFW